MNLGSDFHTVLGFSAGLISPVVNVFRKSEAVMEALRNFEAHDIEAWKVIKILQMFKYFEDSLFLN